MRSFGVRLAAVVGNGFDDAALSGVDVACGSFETDWRCTVIGFCGVCILGSGRSGRSGSSRTGEEAVCQLPLDTLEVSTGVTDRYMRC